MDELTERINQLARKKREQGLTEEEQAEQKQLYKEYLARFRGNFERQLANTDVEYPNGKVVPLSEVNKKKNR
ncbi:MAG: DUF896 domain-containing protein [Ruminococcus sp.]